MNDYYYYHCHDKLLKRSFDGLDEVIEAWSEKHGHTTRLGEIKNRRALLEFKMGDSADHLQRELSLYFSHQKSVSSRQSTLPTSLTPNTISYDTMKRRAFGDSNSLGYFTDHALEWLPDEELTMAQLRELLRRLKETTHPKIIDLICRELEDKRSSGFGSFELHKNLFINQLEELAERKPELMMNETFVQASVTKLQPHADSDWIRGGKERLAYLERLWHFVSPLNAVFNSLKAHVLYHRLDYDRGAGEYNKARFFEYLALPRTDHYSESRFISRIEESRYRVNLDSNYKTTTLLNAISNDEALVSEYLQYFLADAENTGEFKEIFREQYLDKQFATSKVLNNKGNMERWYDLLDNPTMFQRLKDQIELQFTCRNAKVFGSDELVSLELDVKNIAHLVVKIFEINTRNYYETHNAEVQSSLDLDGMIPSEELHFDYSEAPNHRVQRRYEFPQLKDSGIYIVEFIGNGRSSRALIRKGQLKYVERIGSAGHVFRVLNDNNDVLEGASLWMSGGYYHARENGDIVIPFTARQGRQSIVLSHGSFSQLEEFYHLAEDYSFHAMIHIDREQLVRGQQASILISPQFPINGYPASLELLKDVHLTIDCIDRNNVTASKDVKTPDFELKHDADTQYNFHVPDETKSVVVTVKAKVRHLSSHADLPLSSSKTIEINGIDATESTRNLFLRTKEDCYQIVVAGKTGEVRNDLPVQIELLPKDFNQTIYVSLKTDSEGVINLGSLEHFTTVKASISSPSASGVWAINTENIDVPPSLQGYEGGPDLTLALPTTLRAPSRDRFVLIETRQNQAVQDCSTALSIDPGILKLSGLKAGDYQLFVKDLQKVVEIKIASGDAVSSWVLSNRRLLELSRRKVISVKKTIRTDTALVASLNHVTPNTRVHVLATHFYPEERLSSTFRLYFTPPRARVGRQDISQFISGRDIGDEYRYIIDRKRADRFPGNMLSRPGLLINPWAMEDTSTGVNHAAAGGAYGGGGPPGAPTASGIPKPSPRNQHVEGGYASYDFLQRGSLIMNHLKIEDGQVTIPLEKLKGYCLVQILVVDPLVGAFALDLPLASPEVPCRNLTLLKALDQTQTFSEKKQSSLVDGHKPFEVEDYLTASWERYDTLQRVFTLLTTLSGNSTLEEFRFLMNWPNLTPAEKTKKYSEFACHELHFFLSKKDPQFFQDTVAPFLAQKKHKTFLDLYLLGADLKQFLRPWEYQRLNTVEKILLGTRIDDANSGVKGYIEDSFQLLTKNIIAEQTLFSAALKSSALDEPDPSIAPPPPPAMERMRAPAAPAPKMARRSRSAGPSKKKSKSIQMSKMAEVACFDEEEDMLEFESAASMSLDMGLREEVPQLYQTLDATKELGENNYYKRKITEQTPELVPVNAFWRDYARHPRSGSEPFLSSQFIHATSSFTEMAFVLSVLDLPFEAEKAVSSREGARVTVKAKSPSVVFHKEIKPSSPSETKVPILVSQNYFVDNDRYEYKEGERVDKYARDEFVKQIVYTCQVVLTNPSSSNHKLDLLMQIPEGSLPVKSGFYTKGQHIVLSSYATQSIEYSFYFPLAGDYPHYPVQVSKYEETICQAPATTLHVVDEATHVDKTSWEYISQQAEMPELLEYLQTENIHRIDLERIAWRLKEKSDYESIIALLSERHVYHQTLWSYSFKHGDLPNFIDFVKHSDGFVNHCGIEFYSDWIHLDPVARKRYEHKEYAPLVNARAHPLGDGDRTILNNRFKAQFDAFLNRLHYAPEVTASHRLTGSLYLSLQDRIQDALNLFKTVVRSELEETLQYDYMSVYFAFYTQDIETARSVASRYESYPVLHWRQLFETALAQLQEAMDRDVVAATPDNRESRQQQLADLEPNLELAIHDTEISIDYQNVSAVTVNFYRVDIELLFSRQPFVQKQSGQFSVLMPNHSAKIELAEKAGVHRWEIPEEFHSSNVIIEVVGGGQRRSEARFAHGLLARVLENSGQVKVLGRESNRPRPLVYVKVYARMKGGQVRFYKDGYTDIRGRFDYTSLSTNELDNVDRFALLVMDEEYGSVIREAKPPKR
ncbi:MAG: hypothetical protein P1V97_12065 [Planctomycetota bacterium]|nr:hypothetical protein [Planctomycetota bacterium]